MTVTLLDQTSGAPMQAKGRSATGAAMVELIGSDGTDQSLKLEAVRALLAAGIVPSPDQDPVFDHAHGTFTPVTTSAEVLTPPTGCKYARFSCDADVVINTSGNAAVNDGTSVRLFAGVPEVFPVVAGTKVFALSLSGTANVRVTPYKVRS